MNSKSLDEIISSMLDKSKQIISKIEEIQNLDLSKTDMNYNNINNLVEINNNLNISNDKLDDFRIEILKKQNYNNLTCEQKNILREFRFQKILEKTFLPYILYLRLCIDSDN